MTPLKELRLEVDFLEGHLVDVDISAQNTLLEELETSLIATIEIDGTYECLEGIALDIAVVRCAMSCSEPQTSQTHLCGYLAQRIA